jgi:hypothetical protein
MRFEFHPEAYKNTYKLPHGIANETQVLGSGSLKVLKMPSNGYSTLLNAGESSIKTSDDASLASFRTAFSTQSKSTMC